MLARVFVVGLLSCSATEPRAASVHIEPLPPSASGPRPASPPPLHAHEPSAPHLPSFEEAWGKNRGGGHGDDLTDQQLAAPLAHGRFVTSCGAASSMTVTVNAAVQDGKAVGVTVTTNPEDVAVERCIDAAVRGLSWPKSPKMDAVHTTY